MKNKKRKTLAWKRGHYDGLRGSAKNRYMPKSTRFTDYAEGFALGVKEKGADISNA